MKSPVIRYKFILRLFAGNLLDLGDMSTVPMSHFSPAFHSFVLLFVKIEFISLNCVVNALQTSLLFFTASQVLEVLSHVNKRVKPRADIQLPVQELSDALTSRNVTQLHANFLVRPPPSSSTDSLYLVHLSSHGS